MGLLYFTFVNDDTEMGLTGTPTPRSKSKHMANVSTTASRFCYALRILEKGPPER